MKNIRRRKTHQPQALQSLDPCVEVGWFGFDGEVDRLKRDKQVLMIELVKLRQQQQNTRNHLQEMENRLRRAEQKQWQMMNFFARVMQNPNFMQQLVQQKEMRKELEEAFSRKRRRPIDQGPSNVEEVGELGHADMDDRSNFAKLERLEYTEISEFEVSDFGIALNMEGQSGNLRNLEEEHVEEGVEDEVFWEDLLNKGIGETIIEVEDEEDVHLLAEQLDYLGSSPK